MFKNVNVSLKMMLKIIDCNKRVFVICTWPRGTISKIFTVSNKISALC